MVYKGNHPLMALIQVSDIYIYVGYSPVISHRPVGLPGKPRLCELGNHQLNR